MQRVKPDLDRERGAVAVTVALLMTVLLGFAALAIDVAAMYADKQQLQTGADAAALAIVQDCAVGKACDDATIDTVAGKLAVANKNDGAATADATRHATLPKVTVEAQTERDHWFAGIFGTDSSTIGARSTVGWGAPTGGTAVLPLAFSLCDFKAQTGGGLPSGTTPRTIFFTKSSGTSCTGPSGNVVPGGFGWLKPTTGCSAVSKIGDTLYSDTGENVPSTCLTTDFAKVQNQTVLLPIFDATGDSGSSAWYRLWGYAAFKVTGYHFVGQFDWNEPCKGDSRCVRGYFTTFVDTSDAFKYGVTAPDLGAYVARLELEPAP